jgi:hypothetical protein
MNALNSLVQPQNLATAMPFFFAAVLLVILIISFRSRAVVFCQYLERMTGIKLRPADVSRAYRRSGPSGVRELFLELLIREDLKDGPLQVPSDIAVGEDLDIGVRRK